MEMAVVMVLIGIVMTMGLKMVVSTLENATYSETKSKQERVKLALIGYLRTNGRLPCPDITTDPADLSYGLQDRQTPADPDSACSAAGGVVTSVPWRDIGLSRDDVLDGWGNFITYRVANNIDTINWTSKTVGTPFTIAQLGSPTPSGLVGQERNGGGLTPIAPTPVVVVISHGKNGLGARTVKGTQNTAPVAGTDELTNATINSLNYVKRAITEDAAALGGAYDDVVMFITPQDLLQPLVSEGTMKTCVAYCPTATSCTLGGTFSCSPAGVGYCSGSGTACTQAGAPTCSLGTPQCLPPSTGCIPSGNPIVALPPACP